MLIDIPNNMAMELERLHKLLDSPSKDERVFAIKAIAKIHDLFFSPSLELNNPTPQTNDEERE